MNYVKINNMRRITKDDCKNAIIYINNEIETERLVLVLPSDERRKVFEKFFQSKTGMSSMQ